MGFNLFDKQAKVARSVQFCSNINILDNIDIFTDMVNRHFGSVAAATVRNFDVERFPLLLLIAKIKGSLEVFQVNIEQTKGTQREKGDH